MQKSTRSIFQILYRRKIISVLFCALVIGVVFSQVLFNNLSPLRTAEEFNQKCKQDNSERCVKALISSYAKNHTFGQSKAVLDQLQKLDSKYLYCHIYAHAISIAEVEKKPQNWLQVFSYIPDSECSYGYFHGVIEGKYKSDQNFLVDHKVIDEVCLGAAMRDVRNQRSCTHAFGHVLLVQNEGNVSSSLEVCKKVNPKISDICFQGVFMENIQKENLSEHGISNREEWNKPFLDQQIEFCNTLSEPQITECWRSLKPVIMTVVFIPQKATEICQTAPINAAKRACSREVNGQYFISITTGGNQLSEDLCQPFSSNEEGYKTCIKDIINFVILTSFQFKDSLHNTFCPQLNNKESIEFCQKTVQSYTSAS